MQDAWKFVEDEALAERLSDAKGIGTPATRASIIEGFKAQDMLAAARAMSIRSRVRPSPSGN